MPLNVFAASQEIQFQVVARKTEAAWATETVCARILCTDGCEYEVQAVQDAKAQWSSLPLRVAFATVLPRGVVRNYSSGPKTGIRAPCFIRRAFPLKKLDRTLVGFALSCLRDASPLAPEQLEQAAMDTIFNFMGVVHSGGEAPSPTQTGLPRRQVVLQNAAFHVAIDFTGDMSSYKPEVGSSVLVMSVKKSSWQGVSRLETTRLSWVLDEAPWLKVEEPDPGSPPRKALRSSVLDVMSVAAVSALGAGGLGGGGVGNGSQNAWFQNWLGGVGGGLGGGRVGGGGGEGRLGGGGGNGSQNAWFHLLVQNTKLVVFSGSGGGEGGGGLGGGVGKWVMRRMEVGYNTRGSIHVGSKPRGSMGKATSGSSGQGTSPAS